jgi:hypothetical protein
MKESQPEIKDITITDIKKLLRKLCCGDLVNFKKPHFLNPINHFLN